MKKFFQDPRILIGFIIAHVLLFFSFHDRAIFWYIFSGSVLVLIAYSTFQEEVDDEVSFIQFILLGSISGFLLYFVFRAGIWGMEILQLPIDTSIKNLYNWYAPSLFWHYLALVLVAAPGEELFWRGFIQKRLSKYLNPVVSILSASILYASVHIYSGSFLLVLAAFISGFVWGYLYFLKKSMPLVIVSHIIFDLLIFIILPFN
ncbi:CPBP family intramembrane metalloprotease [Bacillus sp. ISL-40]|uniref:CPBP family intramembrane glutamic endopeptidase n=1 Tax=unclassified Bacillus (in: firmicutes) TaxID=185979 RepID=UPI001BE63684|nr:MULTISPECIES: type II CAAX endopeptidase family protein [unclassified Bacillus (in: firmicutes)]MBT2698440.1 CPBP family intramembrane metalloprotease [Bacillus sp. ISL-40]MBT2722460.1 CPBP family intramembrane metalloprotease [Bacillus sp. ISL-46]MBT2741416.1 CPBP family intramembrane metalloprotease [Bacillus sp. ISL-77]